MSRILRRPMFRGGRVSSYGTGIASGLADGGRVGFRTGGSYTSNQGMVLGSDLMNFVKQNPKYGSLEFANTLNPKQFYAYPSEGYQGVGRGGPKIENSPEFLRLFQNYIDPETSLINPDEIDIETGLEIDETGSVSGKGGEGSEGEISTTGSESTNSGEGNNESGGTGGNNNEFFPGEGDPTKYDSDDLESMIKRYEEILGSKKAKGQDVADMLLTFAGSKGDTTMDKFQEFFATEAKKGPGRTEKIKQAAAMLGIKGEQAQKLYETKLKNNKGMFTKKVEEIMNTEGVSRSQATRMALGEPGSIGEAYLKFKGKTGMPPTPQEFDMMAEGYTSGPLPEDYKTSQPTGTYYIPNEMIIVEVVKGEVKSKRPYKPQ